jgi:outer membrane protein assembly factor BamA
VADIDVPTCSSNYERNRCPARGWICLLIGLPAWLFFPVPTIAFGAPPVADDTTSTPVIFAIIVTGNRLTTEAFILREMRLKPGMLADARRLDADRAHLMSLGLFNRVELKVASDQGRAVVQVEVSESLHLYPFLILNWDPDEPSRRTYGLTLYHNNFRGLGARLGGAVWQGTSRGFTLFHQDPWFSFGRFGLDAQILYNTGEIRNAADSLMQRDLFALSAVFRQRLGLQSWLDIGANWQTVDASLDSYTLTAGNRDRVFSLNSALSADHRDYCYYPTRGILFRVAAEANLAVDEPHYFYRESIEFRRYRSFRSIIIGWRVMGRFAQQPLPENYNLAVNSELIRGGESYETGRGGLAATNLELRFNLRRMRYYSFTRAPLLGKYLENLKFSVEGVVFGDAGMAFEYRDGVTKEFRAGGGGLQFQVPFLETVHLLTGWTPQDRLTEPWILVGVGVTY